MNLEKVKRNLDKKQGLLEHAKSQYKKEKTELRRLKQKLKNTTEAIKIIQSIAHKIQSQAHHQIEVIVNKCLTSIFDDPYKFQLEIEKKRGKTEASILLKRRGETHEKPLRTVGGGVNDILSFALRLSCLVLERPPVRRIMILDEPFKNIRGKHNKIRIRGLLQELSENLGFQFILIVDLEAYPEFELGSVITF